MRTNERKTTTPPRDREGSPVVDRRLDVDDRKGFSFVDLTGGSACPWAPPVAPSGAADPKLSAVNARTAGGSRTVDLPKQQLVNEIAGGKLFTVGRLNVLHLKGTPRQMGFQHGALLADQLAKGPLPYFEQYIEKGTGKELLGPAALVWPLLKRYAHYRIASKMPDFAKETLEGMAEGAGIPLKDIERGVVLPDTLVWLFSKVLGLRGAPDTQVPDTGCTSAIAWGDATKNGKLLHGRNLDYLPVGPWPETATVLFHEPDEGHRYVSVASAGVPLGGISAMNEAGLTLTVHQHLLTDRARLGGAPVGSLGDVVMRKASNLDEAEAILNEHRQIGSWTYMITDGKTKEVLTWEGDPHREVGIRSKQGDTTARKANLFFDPALHAGERSDIQPRFWKNNEARHARAHQMLEDGSEEGHDPSSIARILGDTGTIDCRISDAIASLTTVASMVFEPETGTLWVSDGAAPTCHGEFIPFSLETMSHAPQRGHFTGQRIDGEDPKALDAFAAFRDSYLAKTDDEDLVRSIALADKARTLQPEQSLYHHIYALLSMSEGRYEDALDGFQRAIEIGHDDEERVAAFHLWRGRVHDLRGDRSAARSDYLECLDHVADPRVHEAAKKNWTTPFDPRAAAKVKIDFRYVDVARP